MHHRTVIDHPSRRIPLDGPVNFRDLGGYRSGDGRAVRWRAVFRADGLESMTDRDRDVVRRDLGVGIVIDLRTAREIELVGAGPLAGTVARHHLSIIDETQDAWRTALEGGDMVAQYLVMLEQSSAKFVEALGIIAAADAAVVFHCAAGKDRTGLLAALLLTVLGVDRPQIGDDYGLTAEVLPQLRERWRQRTELPGFRERYQANPGWRAAAEKSMAADPVTLGEVLDRLDATHGSVDGWLRDHGLGERVVADLRRRLLVA